MLRTFLSFIAVISLTWSANFYQFVPNADTDGKYDLLFVSNNSFEWMQQMCDSMENCKGFTTWGYFKNNVTTYVQDGSINYALYIKTDEIQPPALPKLLPLPRIYRYGNEITNLSPDFSFASNISSVLLSKAMDRYQNLILDSWRLKRKSFEPLKGIDVLNVNVGSTDETLSIDTNEWYSLSISATAALIEANTIYGAMRGLETFSQLVHYDHDSQKYVIKQVPWSIIDYPQFPHRAIMIDTPRHWLPISVILKVIDGMSYAKLNVLHWHLVDDESFPIEVKSYPNLWKASFSNDERYTQTDLAYVVEYARERGIRVIPEFDGPGHMFSWGVGYPDLWPENYLLQPNCDNYCPTGDCTVPIDVSSPLVFPLLKSVFSEMFGSEGIFQDDFVHFGGDEVEVGCWNGSSRIQTFMQQNNFTNLGQVYLYYIIQTHEIAAQLGKTVINWEDVWIYFSDSLPKTAVINVWLNTVNYVAILESGFRAILSNGNDWYLDNLSRNITAIYLNDPYGGVDPEYYPQVLGGTAPMWAENTDGSVETPRIFPRAGAFAERLWNYDIANKDKSVELLIPRLQDFRCRILMKRGVYASPVYGTTPAWYSSFFNA